MIARLIAAIAVALCAAGPVWAAGPVRAAEPAECRVPAELREIGVKLPHLAARLRAHEPITIVAIGGASTAGKAAGSPDLAYPARLQQALTGLLAGAAINVVNQGAARQTTEQMVARFSRDVLAASPTLVIWETGTVDAVRGVDPGDFAAALESGIDLLKKQAIDIILVDMQFSHRTTAIIEFDSYLGTLHRVGEIGGIYVFPRFEAMRYWSEQNVFNFDEVRPDDRGKLAARVYNCIGWRLADAIRRAVR